MISVIIPACNEAKNLKKLLPYVEELAEGHAVEIIVSIGNCQVDYKECMVNLKRVHLIANKRKGRAEQMNDGVSVAKGAILVFLHADVVPPKGFFEEIKKTISKGFEAGFFSYRFDKKNFFLNINASFTRKKGIFTGGGDQCLFIKKEAFERLGRFDEEQVLMEDFEFFHRMKKNNISYEIVKKDLVVSARKYEENSYLRVNFSNLLLVILFKMGYAPERLKVLHNRLLRLPYQKNT